MNKKTILFIVAIVVLITLTGCGAASDYPIQRTKADWFDFILVIPIGYVLQFFAGLFGNNFALGILLTTIIIRTVAWPIYAKGNDFSMKMQLLNPEIQRLQAKYVTRKDPESQQKMQMEMMALYKKYGVSPLGCLFPLLQMPIFMAMWQVVRRIPIATKTIGTGESEKVLTSMFFKNGLDQKLFGIDLSIGASGWGYILPVFVGITYALLLYLSSKKPDYAKNIPNPNATGQAQQMQKMMKFMNIFMVAMMVGMSLTNGALAFYWIVGNIYSIGQNLLNKKLSARKFKKMQGIEY